MVCTRNAVPAECLFVATEVGTNLGHDKLL